MRDGKLPTARAERTGMKWLKSSPPLPILRI
jgi:hypothetical protein